MPPLPFPDPPLSDGTVTLRSAAERDIPEVLIAYEDDPGLHVSLGEEQPPSGAQLGRRCELAESERLAGVRLWLTITAAGTDTCCGQVTVHVSEGDERRSNMSLWVAPAVRGRGLGRRAETLVGDWLLAACGLRPTLCASPGRS